MHHSFLSFSHVGASHLRKPVVLRSMAPCLFLIVMCSSVNNNNNNNPDDPRSIQPTARRPETIRRPHRTSAKIDVLLALWLRRLPTPIRSAITNFASYDDDDELAKHTDSFFGTHTAANPPAITAAASTVPPDEDDVDDNRINDTITAASTALHFNASRRHFNKPVVQTPHPRSQQNTSSTPTSFRKSSSTSRSCYYHERWALPPRNVNTHVCGQKICYRATALSGGHHIHKCFLFA